MSFCMRTPEIARLCAAGEVCHHATNVHNQVFGVSKVLGRLKARRAKDKAARKAQAEAREQAAEFIRPVLAALNDEDRPPDVRADAQKARHITPIPGWRESLTPHELAELEADRAAYTKTARDLIKSWDHAAVERLLDDVVVSGAVYRLLPDGTVVLEPRASTGPGAAMAALGVAEARDAFRTVGGSFERRIKRCANPTCGKWFFDERGTRKWCCVACGNAHRQLELLKGYRARVTSGAYARRRCPCSRPGCEG